MGASMFIIGIYREFQAIIQSFMDLKSKHVFSIFIFQMYLF